MYYDRLKARVKTAVAVKEAQKADRIDILDLIAPCYHPLHDEVLTGAYTTFHLPGGRGSCKSSFVSLEMVNGVMNDPKANGIVFRRVAGTMRESVYSQISWAIEELGVSALWRGSVSPMAFTYLPTGQQIFFRGLDCASKLKSIKPRQGYFKFIWFEELSEIPGQNTVRSVLQSVMRGNGDFRVFTSFNPPLSTNNWANKYILIPDDRTKVFRTDYRMIPPEWLGEAFLLEAERLQQINEQAYRHEYLGEATGSGGEVFPNLECRTITDEEIQQMQFVYGGVDFGFSIDPAVYMRVSYDRKRDTIYLLDEIYKKHCSNKQLADEIKGKGYHLTGTYTGSVYSGIYPETATVICDCAEPKSIADLRNEGIKALACQKFPGCVMYRIKWLQNRRIVIDPKRTPNAWREFSQYEYMQSKDGEFLADVPDKENHCIDSVSYALDRVIYRRGVSA